MFYFFVETFVECMCYEISEFYLKHKKMVKVGPKVKNDVSV